MDVSLHDTYYVMAHFHLVLSLGAMVSILVGVLYSQESMVSGVPSLASLVSVYYYTGVSLGVALTFLPLHLLGYNTQPRRTPDTPDSYNCWSTLSSLGSGLTVISLVIIPVLNIIIQWPIVSWLPFLPSSLGDTRGEGNPGNNIITGSPGICMFPSYKISMPY